MRTATLAVLLLLAILAISREEELVAPGVAPATMARGPSTSATMARGPSSEYPFAPSRIVESPAALPITPSALAEGRSSPSPLGEGRGEGQLMDLVTILPPPPGQPPARPLSRTEALASVMGSPEFQDTVSPLARLYFATFGRFPDYDGLNYYTGVREGGMTLAEIAEEFARGREFDIRYGALDNAAFVERLFVNVLGNPTQADVRAYWVSELDAGRMTRGQVITDLSESGAFRDRTANQVFVSTAYTEILRQTPPPADFSRWVAFLDAGHPPRSVIDGLLRGP